MALAVNEQSADVKSMAEDWPIVEALLGGTSAMRKAGGSFLPKWPNEDQQAYDARLRTATLFPAFERTVAVMSGKPFAKQVQLSEDTPAEIVSLAEDIDKEGVNLHAFAAEMFREIMGAGIAGILVDSPKKEINGRPPTEAEQKASGVRPYWVRVKHHQILGWRMEVTNGAQVLTQLRIHEIAKQSDGGYGEKDVDRVRVLTPGKYEIFEKQATTDGKFVWVAIETGSTDLDFIPYVPLYGMRKRLMMGTAPLLNLAYLNVKHWQSQSDQDTILHVARVPILLATGFPEGAVITVGGNNAVVTNNATAKLEYVEHTGGAIGAGKESLDALEAQMIQCGAELLVASEGGRTATEDENDAEGNRCDLARIVENFEDALDLALEFTANYLKLPKGGNASLFKDFTASTLSDASDAFLLAMQAAGIISKSTVIKEAQRRGKLSPDIDPDGEIAQAETEGPPPGEETDAGAV